MNQISNCVKELERLKNTFNKYRKYQESLKKEKYDWMPSTQSKIVWEMAKQEEIWNVRQKLKDLEIKIKETRKKHKELNREQNKNLNINS